MALTDKQDMFCREYLNDLNMDRHGTKHTERDARRV